MPLFESDRSRRIALATAWVVPEPSRCVQCGICSFRCPVEIDVRGHVWRGEPVSDRRCLACSQCVDNCPRGLLRLVPVEADRLVVTDPRVG
jgi:NosR/NirI family nitrous oxide reductase transcriptional regulator